MKHLDYDSYKQILDQEKLPIILDFYADWCVPCKNLSPILEELNIEYTGKVNMYKVDVEEQIELSSEFNIRNLPTIIIIKNNEQQIYSGILPKNKYKEIIDNIIN